MLRKGSNEQSDSAVSVTLLASPAGTATFVQCTTTAYLQLAL